MNFDPKDARWNPYISVEGPSRSAVDDGTSLEEPIDEFRERLITGWIRTLRTKAAETGGTPASEGTLRANDSFCRWVAETPEVILRKWHREAMKGMRVARVACC